MYYKRILAPLAALSALLLACAPLAHAGQVGGQLNVSLTIVKSCEVAGESTSGSYRVSSRGCEAAAYRLQDESGKPLAAQPAERDAVTRLDSSDSASPRVVVYW